MRMLSATQDVERPVGVRLGIALSVVLLLGTGACGGGPEAVNPVASATLPPSPGDAAVPEPPPGAGAVVEFGGARVEVEVADDPEERRRGLMGRESLAEDAGMLFLFEAPTETGFWMKDTLVPLSIAFMRSGSGGLFTVVGILDMEPCEADPCPTYAPGTSYDAALEVNLGWFEENGVEVGAEGRLSPAR